MADEIVPLLFLGNRNDTIGWRGAVVDCLFAEGELRRDVLEGLMEKIHSYRGNGIPVLVACVNGIDRSATVVMWYLVERLGMKIDEAVKLIKRKRPVANPHPEWEIKKNIKLLPDVDVMKQAGIGKTSFLVYDTGLALDHALRLLKSGHDVYYFLEWRAERYQRIQDYIPGWGYEGLQKPLDWGMVYDKVETVMFTDVGFGSLADLMRKNGKAVFGASAKGEELELDRVFMIKTFEKLGIKVPKYKIVQGVSGLMNAIEDGKKQFIKLNIFRGNLETCSVESKEEARIVLESAKFGKYAEQMTFIITEPCEGVEVGCDAFFNGKHFLRPYNFGNEVKGTGAQFNKWVESSIWDDVLEKLEPWLAETGYRGNFSLEGFFDGSEITVIDPTCRWFYPGSSAVARYLTNYDEVVYAVAHGLDVTPKPMKPYTCNFIFTRENADSWEKIVLEKPTEDIVFPRCSLKISETEYWACPGDRIVALALGCGDTYEESVKNCIENAQLVKSKLNLEAASSIYEQKYLERLRKVWNVW